MLPVADAPTPAAADLATLTAGFGYGIQLVPGLTGGGFFTTSRRVSIALAVSLTGSFHRVHQLFPEPHRHVVGAAVSTDLRKLFLRLANLCLGNAGASKSGVRNDFVQAAIVLQPFLPAAPAPLPAGATAPLTFTLNSSCGGRGFGMKPLAACRFNSAIFSIGERMLVISCMTINPRLVCGATILSRFIFDVLPDGLYIQPCYSPGV